MGRTLFYMLWFGSVAGAIPLAGGLLKTLMLRKTIPEIFGGWKPFTQILFAYEPYKNFFKWDSVNVAGWLIVGYVGYSVLKNLLYGRMQKEETYQDQSEYGSHGRAQWQEEEEIMKNYYQKEQQGFVVGDVKERRYEVDKNYARIANDGGGNLNMIAFGAPGSQKTTGLILPNILHTAKNLGYSMVITDPKAEIYKETAEWVAKQGYEIKVLDFLHLTRGDRINLLDYIHEDEDLLKMAQSYITGMNIAHGSKGSGDPIWDAGEQTLLAALLGYVKQTYAETPQKQTFGEVAKILTTEFSKPETLPSLFDPITGTAKNLFQNFLLTQDKVRDGIVSGLAMKLTLFLIPRVQQITRTSDFELADLGRKKMALYVMVSDCDRTYSALVTLFWSILFDELYHLRLKDVNAQTPVFCAMDELANIGKIRGFQEKLSTMRSRQIYPLMIWQSLPQLQDRYPGNAWADVLSMCDIRLLLSANDTQTQNFFSELMGKTTIGVQGISQQMTRDEPTYRSQTDSSAYTGRPLLYPNEIGALPTDEIIVLQTGRQPVKLKKLQYRYWEKRVGEAKEYTSIPPIPGVKEEHNKNAEGLLDIQM